MESMLITGATGLAGRYVLDKLLVRYPAARFYCTLRPDSPSRLPAHERVIPVACDLTQPDDLARALGAIAPVDEVLHIVQLRYAATLIDAMAAWPTRPRLIVVGTTGVFSGFQRYAAEYETAEGHLRDRYPHHVLLRPTMIYGDVPDKNLHKLIRFVDRFGCFPLFGTGAGKLQPLHYQDLGDAILAVLERPAIAGQAYNLSGGSVVSYGELLRLVGALLGRPCRRLPVPIALGRMAGRAAEALFAMAKREPPLREEQVLRLLEDKHFDHTAASEAFGFAPRAIDAGLRDEIAQLASLGLIRPPRPSSSHEAPRAESHP